MRNLHRLRDRVEHRDIWPVLKADAYGHGAIEVARALAPERVAGFCVATACEGRELRQAGIEQPILMMIGPALDGTEDPCRTVLEYGLSCAVADEDAAERLVSAARTMGLGPVSVHLKLDTGMGRLGVLPDQALALAAAVAENPALSLDGLFSNLASADSIEADDPGTEFAAQQAAIFAQVCEALQEAALLPPHRTLANSAAIMHHPESWEPDIYTGVRPGLAIYGASLNPGQDPVRLLPAMRLCTRIVALRELPKGVTVGYGMTATTYRPSRIGVLPLGYHDGLPRSLSNRGWVFVRGRRAPIIGRISMDLTLVDVTDISAVRSGDEVVLFGGGEDAPPDQDARESGYAATLAAALAAVDSIDPDPEAGRFGRGRGPIGVEEVAAWGETIPHEILSRVGARVPRVVSAAGAESPPQPASRRAR